MPEDMPEIESLFTSNPYIERDYTGLDWDCTYEKIYEWPAPSYSLNAGTTSSLTGYMPECWSNTLWSAAEAMEEAAKTEFHNPASSSVDPNDFDELILETLITGSNNAQ